MAKRKSAPRRESATQSTHAPEHRSPCPVACLLDIVGDRWTLLVVRDLFFGRTRFKDLVASPEGIPTNILSDRLARLLKLEFVEQIPATDGTKRLAYQLTKKGQSLRPILEVMRDWGLKWEKGTQAMVIERRDVQLLGGHQAAHAK